MHAAAAASSAVYALSLSLYLYLCVSSQNSKNVHEKRRASLLGKQNPALKYKKQNLRGTDS
jgi:hypothetical protein